MKFCILGDTHWGVRNDIPVFYKHFEKFYNNLFDDLLSQGITDIFQLGDLFDRRKYINFRTLNESKRIFFDKLREKQLRLHTLIGNHDTHWKESLEINSSSLLLNEYDNITVYQHPTTITVDKTTIDVIPWICKENEEDISKFINSSKSDLCLGHFEIVGFAMYKGVESHEGLSIELFEKYERVFSGHYHTRSQKGNITYVGTPYEMTWQDFDDAKGYHIFDTDTRQLTFVENQEKCFIKVEYDDKQKLVDLDQLDLRDCFVKVVVINKVDMYKFDMFVQKLYNKGCYEIKILDDMTQFTEGEVSEDINLEDTVNVLTNYIDSLETDADKDKIKNFVKSLYVEAINTSAVD